MLGDTECCGYRFKERGGTFLGVLTFSVPLVICGILIFPVFFVFGLLNSVLRNFTNIILVVIRANLKIIYITPLLPLLRCKLAGGLFNLYPKFSGLVYKSFNFTLLIMLWIVIGVFIWFIL